jgi:C-terminal processing protease CtpA/Prc
VELPKAANGKRCRTAHLKPVYVLTSPVTISAAEEFAYDLQALGRATVVGETTTGAAHLTAGGQVAPHLFITISIARPINPVTKTNWEGVGVIPDIKVSARDALRIAQERIR